MRPGRKRKAGDRFPGGKLKSALESRASVSEVRRLTAAMLTHSRDAAWGSVPGRMFLLGQISAAEYDAAKKFSNLRAMVDVALGLPARNPKALDYNRSIGGPPANDDKDWHAAAIRALDDAQAAVGWLTKELAMVERVAIEDCQPETYMDRLAFTGGLKKLVEHWRLT